MRDGRPKDPKCYRNTSGNNSEDICKHVIGAVRGHMGNIRLLIISALCFGKVVFFASSVIAASAPIPMLITFGSLSERETAIFVARDYGLFAKHGLDARAVHVRNGAVAL